MKVEDGTEPVDNGPDAIKLRTHKIQIRVIRVPETGSVIRLPGPEARIGSAADCDLVLKDQPSAVFTSFFSFQNDRIRVIDSGSRSGTSIDGTMVHGAYARPDSAITIGTTTLRMRMLSEVVELPLSARDHFGRLLGRSIAMRLLFTQLERVAPTDATLLIEGRPGLAKELAAEAVHRANHRASRPFVVFDCSALPPTLIEANSSVRSAVHTTVLLLASDASRKPMAGRVPQRDR